MTAPPILNASSVLPSARQKKNVQCSSKVFGAYKTKNYMIHFQERIIRIIALQLLFLHNSSHPSFTFDPMLKNDTLALQGRKMKVRTFPKLLGIRGRSLGFSCTKLKSLFAKREIYDWRLTAKSPFLPIIFDRGVTYMYSNWISLPFSLHIFLLEHTQALITFPIPWLECDCMVSVFLSPWTVWSGDKKKNAILEFDESGAILPAVVNWKTYHSGYRHGRQNKCMKYKVILLICFDVSLCPQLFYFGVALMESGIKKN